MLHVKIQLNKKWQFFEQLYNIHGYNNGHYIPLVFALLVSKSEDPHIIVPEAVFNITGVQKDKSKKRFKPFSYVWFVVLVFSVFALLVSKSEDTYRKFLQHVIDICSARSLTFKSAVVYVDLEITVHNVFRPERQVQKTI
jgi:hypothetical protein